MRALLAACCWLFIAVPLAAAPPRLVRSTPADGEMKLAPGVAELRFEFDQDMDPAGYSLCGGGPKFPTVRPQRGPGSPRWASPRVFVVPVRLQPEHDYELSLNCPSAQNFRSAAGEALLPTPIRFRTAPGAVPARAFDAATATATLRAALDQHYAHRTLHPVEWDERFAEFDARLKGAKTLRDYAKAAAELLSATNDLHLWLEVDDERFAAGRRQVDPNGDFRLLSRLVPSWRPLGKEVVCGRFDDGVAYLAIGSWAIGDRDLAKALDQLAEWRDAPGLVIDVRFNSGGRESAAQCLAGCFVERPTPYAKHRTCDPAAADGLGPEVTRVFKPNAGHGPFRGRVAVLIGPRVMSSCESFVMMMAAAPRTRSFGAKTWGSSGNPRPIELAEGLTCYLPSWIDMAVDGRLLEGIGLEPDEVVEFVWAEDRPTSDPVLERALAWLRAPADE